MKGSELIVLRETIGLNCSQAAEFLGVDRTTLVRWEKSETLPRLAAAGAATLLRPGSEIAEWIATQKPAARRAISARAAEYAADVRAYALEPGEYARGDKIHVTEIAQYAPLPVSDWPANCDACSMEPAMKRGVACGGCPNMPEPLLPGEKIDFKRGGPDPVAEYRRDVAPELPNDATPPIHDDGTMSAAAAEFRQAVLHQAGVPACSCVECDEARRNAAGGDGPTDTMASDGQPAIAGEQVEKLRKVLQVKFAQFGGRGIRELSGKTGMLPEDLIRFVKEDGIISITQFDAIMDVLRETEGA